MITISSNLNIMIKAVEKASKLVIRDFGEVEKLQISKKGPRDFVTKTDKRVENIIIEELSKTKKNYSFLSEEIGEIKNQDKENIWIIDPIDGTTNFLHGIPHFAICVALQSNKEIVSGLIFDPIKDEMFFAEKNKGSYLNNQRLRVSKKNSLSIILVSHDPRDVQYLGGDVVLFSENGQTDFYNKKSFWSKFSNRLLPSKTYDK